MPKLLQRAYASTTLAALLASTSVDSCGAVHHPPSGGAAQVPGVCTIQENVLSDDYCSSKLAVPIDSFLMCSDIPAHSGGVASTVAIRSDAGLAKIIGLTSKPARILEFMPSGVQRELPVSQSVQGDFGRWIALIDDYDKDGERDLLIEDVVLGGGRHTRLRTISSRTGIVLGECRRSDSGIYHGISWDTCSTPEHDELLVLSSTIDPHSRRGSGVHGVIEVLRIPSMHQELAIPEVDTGGIRGWCVRWYADFDHDGFPDLLVSDPRFQNRDGGKGKLEIVSGKSGVTLLTLTAGQLQLKLPVESEFGTDIRTISDMDRDGLPEVAVAVAVSHGPDQLPLSSRYEPAVYVVSIGRRELYSKCAFDLGALPFAVTPWLYVVDDADNDGFKDLLVVCSGRNLSRDDRLLDAGGWSVVSALTGEMLSNHEGNWDPHAYVGLNASVSADTYRSTVTMSSADCVLVLWLRD